MERMQLLCCEYNYCAGFRTRAGLFTMVTEKICNYRLLFSMSPRADRPASLGRTRIGYSTIGVSLGDMGGF